MRWNDLYNETAEALSANKVRSSLTMLGIVIGISSVIVMVAIGRGAQASIEQSIESAGANLVIVMPGAQGGSGGGGISGGRGSARTLTVGDADAIAEEISGIAGVAPEISSRYQVSAKGTNTNTSVVGTTASYAQVRIVSVAEGAFISERQVQSGSKVAVLGPTTRNDLFGEGADAVGQTIRINDVSFTVIGVTVAKGGTGFSNPDDTVIIPLTAAQRYLSGNSEYVGNISIAAESSDVSTLVQQDVTALLLDRHNIRDPLQADFSTLNQADLISTVTGATQTFTFLLGSVAGISLLVGGIGIMNMMLTTVTERTREIGLRKAMGAKQADISKQFLSEAVALTFIGGVIGIALGAAVSYGVTSLGIVSASVSAWSVILAFGVSAGIGILFGWYPARRASRLNPIEALRYE